MKARVPHAWNISPSEATAIQRKLRLQVQAGGESGPIRTVAGADIALDKSTGTGYAGVIVYDFPALNEIERVSAEGPLTFPYIPGLLTFREGSLLLDAFSRLKTEPDLLMFDAHGYAHPRRFGLAAHLSVVLDKAGIGVAKSRLIGSYPQPPNRVGAWAPLVDRDEVIGAVLHTRVGVRPIFVSVGHRVDLETAIELTLACSDGYRIPKTTREADRYVGQLKTRARHGSRR